MSINVYAYAVDQQRNAVERRSLWEFGVNDTKRFPADVYDVILSVLQIGIIGELLLVRTLWAGILAAALFILFYCTLEEKAQQTLVDPRAAGNGCCNF